MGKGGAGQREGKRRCDKTFFVTYDISYAVSILSFVTYDTTLQCSNLKAMCHTSLLFY